MIKNNKGAILVVTIVSMMILTIIGYITLQMVSNQNVMDTYDQTKIRVDYAAEGIVERARGYIDYYTHTPPYYRPESEPMSIPGGGTTTYWGDVGKSDTAGDGMLFSMIAERGGKWNLLEDTGDGSFTGITYPFTFDASMYPNVHARVYCESVDVSVDGFDNINDTLDVDGGLRKSYRIVGIASATVNTAGGSVIVSTVACYFYTKKRVIGDTDAPTKEIRITNHIRGWRKF